MAKYISIDLETTGLNPEHCDILEIGAILEDTLNILPYEKLPKFHCYVKKEVYKGEPYAFYMNSAILKRIAEQESGYSYIYPGDVVLAFKKFLLDNGFPDERPMRFTLAGKNVGAGDLQFLKLLPKWKEFIKPRHRILDPGNMLFDPLKDEELPGLGLCLERCGFKNDVKHTALEDAWDVIRILRKYWRLGE